MGFKKVKNSKKSSNSKPRHRIETRGEHIQSLELDARREAAKKYGQGPPIQREKRRQFFSNRGD